MNLMAEMRGLACQQLSEQLTTADNLTLHSDGTSKFGQHYGGFQVSTPDSAYSLGLSEMLTGSADGTLNTLKIILSDIDLVVGEGTGNKICGALRIPCQIDILWKKSSTACWKNTGWKFCLWL